MRKRSLYISAALLLGCVATTGCIRRPEGVQTDKKMAPVVADLELAEAYVNKTHGNDSVKEALVSYIIRKHGLTREEFETTMDWYGRNVDKYYELTDLVEKELTLRKREVSGGRSLEIESTDLWPYSRMMVLSPLSGSNALEFSVPTADVAPGDKVRLRLRLPDRADFTAILGVEYDDGSKGFVHRILNGTKKIDITYQTDTALNVSRIFGNMMTGPDSEGMVWMDSISLGTLPFDSLDYYNIHSQRRYMEPKGRRKPKKVESDSIANPTGETTADDIKSEQRKPQGK